MNKCAIRGNTLRSTSTLPSQGEDTAHPAVFKWRKLMPDRVFRLRRGWKSFTRRLRELQIVTKGALSTRHPIMAHIIPIRRCNLSCTYCNEYDDFSKPVPTETIIARINCLADLGTVIVTLSGGEPLLHPDLDDIIRAMRHRGLIAGMIT